MSFYDGADALLYGILPGGVPPGTDFFEYWNGIPVQQENGTFSLQPVQTQPIPTVGGIAKDIGTGVGDAVGGVLQGIVPQLTPVLLLAVVALAIVNKK